MKNLNLVAAQTSFLDSGYSELYTYSEYDKTLNFNKNEESGKIDIISGLYLNDYVTNDFNNSRLYNISYPDLAFSRSLNSSYSMLYFSYLIK